MEITLRSLLGLPSADAQAVAAPSKTRRVKKEDLRKQYETRPSFVDLLPWTEYLPETGQILLKDAVSRMAGFELEPIPTEGRSQSDLADVRASIGQLITECLPEHDNDPWVIQISMSAERNMNPAIAKVRSYVDDHAKGSQYTEHYLDRMESHINEVANPNGYFWDDAVTDSIWGAKTSSIRLVIYRRYWKTTPDELASHELEDAVDKIKVALSGCGIKFRMLDGEAFYNWMFQWFNPAPAAFDGDASKALREVPYPGDENVPIGRDFAELLFLDEPVADREKGWWYFNGLPHTVIQAGKLRRAPKIGQLTGEIDRGTVYALTDKLPEGVSIMVTITVVPQQTIADMIAVVDERAMGDTAESRLVKDESAVVLEKQAKGDRLYPMEIAFFCRGKNERNLKRSINSVSGLLSAQGLVALMPDSDPIALDSYIKNIPGVYIPELDRESRRRARITFASQIAALAPLYGRSRGSGNPGIAMWNRSAEPYWIDPLNPDDRAKNAHMLVIGPTGAGKSATLNVLVDAMMAVHRPRVFIIEAGGSFDPLAEFSEAQGLTVNRIKINMKADVSIPPFADLWRAANESTDEDKVKARDDTLQEINDDLEDHDDNEEEVRRDYLGEAVLTMRLMVSGGVAEENAKITTGIVGIFNKCLLRTAEIAAERPPSVSKVIKPSQIAEELRVMSREADYVERGQTLREYADSIDMFCSGLNGQLFNREGQSWPECDLTIVDVGMAAQEGRESTLAIAYISLMQTINDIAEREQNSERQMIVLTDEGHLITKNELLAPYVVKMTKMWRKLGAWYWLATQSLGDFTPTSMRMLSMMEFWIGICLEADDIEDVKRLRTISSEQANMLGQTRKSQGNYTEAVVLSSKFQSMFRIVPPPLALTLAMTEQHEKKRRAEIQKEHNLKNGAEASEFMAHELVLKRREKIAKLAGR